MLGMRSVLADGDWASRVLARLIRWHFRVILHVRLRPNMSLDRRYFERVAAETIGDARYEVYRAENSLVLMSTVTGEPLAALTLRTQSSFPGKFVIWKRGDEADLAHFQGLCSEDNQEFEYVLTNFSEHDMINFNIMREAGQRVDQVDPGPLLGVNEVNELEPLQSFPIRCDQKDNLALMLSTVFGGATVAQDQAASGGNRNNSKAMYCHLSVVPESDIPQMATQFSETAWVCTDTVTLKRGTTTHGATRGGSSVGVDEEPHQYRERGCLQMSWGSGSDDDETDDVMSSPLLHSSRSDDAARGNTIKNVRLADDMPSDPLVWSGATKLRGSRKIGSMRQPDLAPRHSPAAGAFSSHGEVGRQCNFAERRAPKAGAFVNRPGPCRGVRLADGMPSAALIATSKVATVGTSGRHIDVTSVVTDKEYDYTLNSAPCVLAMSVQTLLQFTGHVLSPAQGYAILDTIKTSHYKSLLESKIKVYASDMCVICLDEKPDTVIFGCGHQCLHDACKIAEIVDCPMCRGNITATLMV